MSKMLMVVMAGLFSAGVTGAFAQTMTVTPAAPSVQVTAPVSGAPAVHVTPAMPEVKMTPEQQMEKKPAHHAHKTMKKANKAKSAHRKAQKKMG